MNRTVHFAIPGDLATPTGGYGYDRRLVAELPLQGWQVEHVPLPDGFPYPSEGALAETRDRLGALPGGAVVMVDGLAFAAMPGLARDLAARLRLVALVHHPLADEGGLSVGETARLERSEREAMRSARRVICTSRTTARRLIEGFGVDPQRLDVAPPGTARQPRAPGAGEPPMILSVAAVVPRKGHDTLLEALARMRARPWRCRVVGALDRDPGWVASLRRLGEELGIAGRIAFAGSVPDPAGELQRADVFALPSRHEGYGMAFAEALAHGLPIVGCRAGAVPEVVPPEAGTLVAIDDAQALAAALGGLLDDAAARRRMAAASWRAGQSLPRWDETARIVARSLDEAAG